MSEPKDTDPFTDAVIDSQAFLRLVSCGGACFVLLAVAGGAAYWFFTRH